MRYFVVLAPLLLLSACGDGPGTAISIQGNDSDGAFNASADKDGRVAIDLPGFKANLKVPSIRIDADSFDLDGVKLPAGSTITTMNIADGKDGGSDGLAIRFHSPIAPAAVRDWFTTRLADKGYALTAKGESLTGKTDEGEAFAMTLQPSGQGETDGAITVGGK